MSNTKIYYVDPADLVQAMETYRIPGPPDIEGYREELPVGAWVNPDLYTVALAKSQLRKYGQVEPCVMKIVAYDGHLLCIPNDEDADYSEDTPNIIHAAHELRWPTVIITL
jgi:hypothetical protein